MEKAHHSFPHIVPPASPGTQGTAATGRTHGPQSSVMGCLPDIWSSSEGVSPRVMSSLLYYEETLMSPRAALWFRARMNPPHADEHGVQTLDQNAPRISPASLEKTFSI